MANDALAQLLARYGVGGQQPMAGAMPPGLLADPGMAGPQGSSPVLPTSQTTPLTPTTTAPTTPTQQQMPPTPPVLPYQGDPNRYGFGAEHQFFGGLNGQPYGLTSFTGYKPNQQITQQTLEDMLKKLLPDLMQPKTPGVFADGGN